MPPNWRGMINAWRGVWVDAPRRAESRACPPDPSPHVQPKPGGAARLPRLLLVKPDRTGDRILDGILGHGQPLRAEVITQEIETPLDPADAGLVRALRTAFDVAAGSHHRHRNVPKCGRR